MRSVATDRQEAFFEWLSSRVSSKQLADYRQLLHYIDDFAQKKRLVSDDIVTITKIETVRKVRTAFETNRLFRFVNRGKTDKISVLLRFYEAYLSELAATRSSQASEPPTQVAESQAVENQDNPTSSVEYSNESSVTALAVSSDCTDATMAAVSMSNRERFTQYLRNESMDVDGVNATLYALEYSDSIITECQLDVTPILEATTLQDAAHSYSELLMCSTFKKKDAASGGLITKAISAYFAMLRTPDAEKTAPGSAINTVSQQPTEDDVTAPDEHSDNVIRMISERGLHFVDKRQQAGRLWVIGDDSLTSFFAQCRELGHDFRYVPRGSRSTGGKSGWYLLDELHTLHDSLYTEVDVLLSSAKYHPLREALKKEKIETIDQLKEIKLWQFMNRNNLYSLAKRQEIATAVHELVFPPKPTDMTKQYVLHVGELAYSGISPSETLVGFCEVLSQKFPLKFRNIIGVSSPEGSVVISRTKPVYPSLSLANPVAYVSAELTPMQVTHIVEWIAGRCGETIIATMDEPSNSPTTETVVEHDTRSPEINIPQTSPVVEDQSEEILSNVTPNNDPMVSLAEEHVRHADMDGLTLDELQDKMRTTMVAVKQYVNESRKIAYIRDKVYHVETLIDWEEGADKLEAILEKLMQKNNGYVSAAQLYDYARMNMNMFLNDNDMNDERSVYDMAAFLFDKVGYHDKRFTFYGKAHISRSDAAVHSNFDIFCKFAEEQGGYFTLTELEDHLKGIGLKTGNLRQQMKLYVEPFFMYYDEGIVLYTRQIEIDDAWKNAVAKSLAALFSDVGDHIILRDVQAFWYDQLPQLPGNRAWTPLLLQGILRFWGEELGAHTIKAMDGQALDTVHAMLVSCESPIMNFGDVVASYLVENGIEERLFDAEELRTILVDAGMIHGNELIWNMHKALGGDERYAWDAKGERVLVKV